jgi:hypothetical protein
MTEKASEIKKFNSQEEFNHFLQIVSKEREKLKNNNF